jgi:hypothetical protein
MPPAAQRSAVVRAATTTGKRLRYSAISPMAIEPQRRCSTYST